MRAFVIRPGQSTAQYTAHEKITLAAIRNLLKIAGDDNTAIGKTQQLTGEIDLRNGPPAVDVHVSADLRTLDSGVNLRDERIRSQYLESNRFPNAVFQAVGIPLPQMPADGSPISFDAPGTMTVREITKPFLFKVTAQLSTGTITGRAVGTLRVSDFGFDPPVISGAIVVEEGLGIQVDIVAGEVSCIPHSP